MGLSYGKLEADEAPVVEDGWYAGVREPAAAADPENGSCEYEEAVAVGFQAGVRCWRSVSRSLLGSRWKVKKAYPTTSAAAIGGATAIVVRVDRAAAVVAAPGRCT